MLISIEIDGIISTPVRSKVALNDVSKCEVLPGAKEALDEIKKFGHKVFIYTCRDASLGPETETWLQKNKIHYDGIMFNKPEYDINIDLKSYKHTKWEQFFEDQKYRLRNS